MVVVVVVVVHFEQFQRYGVFKKFFQLFWANLYEHCVPVNMSLIFLE